MKRKLNSFVEEKPADVNKLSSTGTSIPLDQSIITSYFGANPVNGNPMNNRMMMRDQRLSESTAIKESNRTKINVALHSYIKRDSAMIHHPSEKASMPKEYASCPDDQFDFNRKEAEDYVNNLYSR